MVNQTCFYHRKYIGIDTIFGMVEIFEVTQPNDSYLAALNDLLPQLSASAQPMSMNSLVELVQSDAVHLYLAAVDGEVVGSLTLVVFPIPTGVRAWIEDVVVDVRGRGKGVGKALTHHALLEAKKYGALTVDLTSRPSREAANKLYQSVGFQKRETNVYRFKNC